jgi:hypothetical protein
VIDIPENNLQPIAIEIFIQFLLALLVITNTSFYYGVKISQLLIGGFGFIEIYTKVSYTGCFPSKISP